MTVIAGADARATIGRDSRCAYRGRIAGKLYRFETSRTNVRNMDM
jgi:hypothetical protein